MLRRIGWVILLHLTLSCQLTMETDCAVFREGGVFLLRAAEALGWRRGRHALAFLHRQGRVRRPGMPECARCRALLHFLQVSLHSLASMFSLLTPPYCRARTNQYGHLEPDAPEEVVQKSLGFEGYEVGRREGSEADSKSP